MKKRNEMRHFYIIGLRSLFNGLRRHMKSGSSPSVIYMKTSEIDGYIMSGFYTEIISNDEYHKIGDIATKLYLNYLK